MVNLTFSGWVKLCPIPLTVMEGKVDPGFQQFVGIMTLKLRQLTPDNHRLVLELFDADGNKLSENYEDFNHIQGKHSGMTGMRYGRADWQSALRAANVDSRQKRAGMTRTSDCFYYKF